MQVSSSSRGEDQHGEGGKTQPPGRGNLEGHRPLDVEARVIGDAEHPDFRSPNKWQNGFVGRDGAVYAIPGE